MKMQKIFRRRASGSDSVRDDKIEWHTSPWHYVIRSFRIPYCSACIRRQGELREHVPAARVARLMVMTPLAIPFAFALFFALRIQNLIVTSIAAFTMGITAFSSWRRARFDLVPATTEITRACQMSDRLGWYDTGFHRIYAFENTSYASAFADANRDRVWTAQDQKTMVRRKAISTTLILTAVAVGFVWLYVLKQK